MNLSDVLERIATSAGGGAILAAIAGGIAIRLLWRAVGTILRFALITALIIAVITFLTGAAAGLSSPGNWIGTVPWLHWTMSSPLVRCPAPTFVDTDQRCGGRHDAVSDDAGWVLTPPSFGTQWMPHLRGDAADCFS